MDVNFLLDKAKEVCGVHYDKDLAPRLGVKPTAISNYRKGVSHPDPVVCATLAGLTGIPLVQVIGMVGEARAISREEKAVWRKLAGMTAAILLFVDSAIGTPAKASTFDAISQMQMHADISQHIHYAKLPLRWQWSQPCTCRLRFWPSAGSGGSGSGSSCLPQRPPKWTPHSSMHCVRT